MGGGNGGRGGVVRSGDSDIEKTFVYMRLRLLNGRKIVAVVCNWECFDTNTIVYENGNLSMPKRFVYPSAHTFGIPLFLRSSHIFKILVI